MKVIAIEELEALSPSIHAEAIKVGCTHARVSEPIWRGPAHKGAEGAEMRMVEFSWFKAILLKDAVVFDETEPERFLAVLEAYGLGDVESMQPMRRHGNEPMPMGSASEANGTAGPSGNADAVVFLRPVALPERQAVTVYVLDETKAKMEEQANQAGLSVGGLLDQIFGGPGG